MSTHLKTTKFGTVTAVEGDKYGTGSISKFDHHNINGGTVVNA
jgi:hypothetical protein